MNSIDRVERLVRVMEEDVLLADHREDVVGFAQRRHDLRGEGLVAQLARARRATTMRGKSAKLSGPLHVVDVVVGIELERLAQPRERARVGPRR